MLALHQGGLPFPLGHQINAAIGTAAARLLDALAAHSERLADQHLELGPGHASDGNRAATIAGRCLVGLAGFTWIDAGDNQLASVFAPLARIGEQHLGLSAQAQPVLASVDPVPEAPTARAVWPEDQRQAATVVEC